MKTDTDYTTPISYAIKEIREWVHEGSKDLLRMYWEVHRNGELVSTTYSKEEAFAQVQPWEN